MMMMMKEEGPLACHNTTGERISVACAFWGPSILTLLLSTETEAFRPHPTTGKGRTTPVVPVVALWLMTLCCAMSGPTWWLLYKKVGRRGLLFFHFKTLFRLFQRRPLREKHRDFVPSLCHWVCTCVAIITFFPVQHTKNRLGILTGIFNGHPRPSSPTTRRSPRPPKCRRRGRPFYFLPFTTSPDPRRAPPSLPRSQSQHHPAGLDLPTTRLDLRQLENHLLQQRRLPGPVQPRIRLVAHPPHLLLPRPRRLPPRHLPGPERRPPDVDGGPQRQRRQQYRAQRLRRRHAAPHRLLGAGPRLGQRVRLRGHRGLGGREQHVGAAGVGLRRERRRVHGDLRDGRVLGVCAPGRRHREPERDGAERGDAPRNLQGAAGAGRRGSGCVAGECDEADGGWAAGRAAAVCVWAELCE